MDHSIFFLETYLAISTFLYMKKIGLSLLFLGLLFPAFAQNGLSEYVAAAPFTMSEIKEPVFPAKDFPITAYNAVGDGHTLNTDAFAKAIAACSEAGGGHVTVPPGIWLTGPIELKSNVDLHVERGALVVFTTDFSQYPMGTLSPKSNTVVTTPPISGYKLKNIAITGEGIIDGAGEAWRPVKKEKMTAGQWKKITNSGGVLSKDGKLWWPSEEAMNGEAFLKTLKKNNPKTANEYIPARVFLRPNLVHLTDCENVLIEDITLRNSPKFVLYPSGCTNIIVRYTTVFNEWWAQNGDGIDISACQNVIVYRCNVSVGDDGICMKSSSGAKQDTTQSKLKNVVVAECTVYHGHGGFVIGSNTDGGMENIFVKNCTFIGTDIGVRVKSNAGRGGVVKNIFVENIYMRDIQGEAISFDTYYDDVPAGADRDAVRNTKADKTPDFHHFYFKNIYCTGAETAFFFRGLPSQAIHDIRIENSVLSAEKGLVMQDADRLFFKNVKLYTNEVLELDTQKGLYIEK